MGRATPAPSTAAKPRDGRSKGLECCSCRGERNFVWPPAASDTDVALKAQATTAPISVNASRDLTHLDKCCSSGRTGRGSDQSRKFVQNAFTRR